MMMMMMMMMHLTAQTCPALYKTPPPATTIAPLPPDLPAMSAA
jgi:hypothetical protein